MQVHYLPWSKVETSNGGEYFERTLLPFSLPLPSLGPYICSKVFAVGEHGRKKSWLQTFSDHVEATMWAFGSPVDFERVELSLFCRSAESSQVCRAGVMRREAWHIFLLRACDAAVVWPSRAWNVDEVTGNYCDSYMLHATCCKVLGCCSSVSVLGFV